jgi:hypothetical protein
MKYILLLLFFLANLYGGPVAAQNPPKAKLYTLEVTIYTNDDTTFVPTVTHAGDTVDLGSYITDHYEYPDKMTDLMIDGSMYYRLTLDGSNRMDSLVCQRPIDRYFLMDPDPLPLLFKNLSVFLFPKGIKAGILRIRVNINWDMLPKPQPVERIDIVPYKKG